MFRLIATCVMLAIAAPVFAEDVAKPIPLTAKEIEEGYIRLFDGETTFGWKIDGAARVEDDVLVLGKGGKKSIAYPTAAFGPYWEVSFQIIGPALIHESGTIEHPAKLAKWVTYKFTRDVKLHQFSSTHSTVKSVTSTRPKGSEVAAFCIETNGDEEVKIQSVKLKPLTAKSLFTGKNLDGWKVNAADPKRTLSKFEVTKDGELSVKNGPGDLVTEKEFDNFVLQFECKTLGKALNSGIFFRCIPGQYQNGYEAQIQNAYLNDDRTKPADYGTGAVYRRVAARKVVSNDNEWFSMTVVANGKHIATWVNGYQTVDWTDDRKENDNPRQGYRAAKGPLSIQGHDKTTDLLFKNIRIAELPAENK
jgi:3-keto-disaccharide hydrolase